MRKTDKGHFAKCNKCGFESELRILETGIAQRVFESRKRKIADPVGMKEASGDPSGDLCGMCSVPKVSTR